MTAFLARDVRKRFRATSALEGVSLEIGDGELFGLLGPNGAGKSTLVKIAVGLTQPSEGSIEVVGHPAGSPEARSTVGYLAELFRFPSWLSADEVLRFHQRLAGSDGGANERRELLALVALDHVSERRVGSMSKGMQQRLGLAQALVGRPKLLILDEPTSALDPEGRHMVRRLLEHLRERGTAVLLNSHLLSEVELVCDRIAILVAGRIVTHGDPAQLAGAGGVEIDTDDGTQRFAGASRDEIPALVARLVAEGARIFGVRETHRTLEEVYLAAVQQERSA